MDPKSVSMAMENYVFSLFLNNILTTSCDMAVKKTPNNFFLTGYDASIGTSTIQH